MTEHPKKLDRQNTIALIGMPYGRLKTAILQLMPEKAL
jgi:hypothetical protein